MLVSVGGQLETSSNVVRLAVTRRNVDGSLDASFGTAGLAITKYARPTDDVAFSLEPAPDGKTIVSVAQDSGERRVLRITADGKLDTSFGENGVARVPLGAAAVDPAGRTLAIGQAGFGFIVRRYDDHGVVDPTFGTVPPGEINFSINGTASELALGIHPDGRIVVAGIRGSDLFLSRTDARGAADGAFGMDGTTTIHTNRRESVIRVDHVTALADGGVIVAAIVDGKPAVARVGADGRPAVHVAPNGTYAVFGNGFVVGSSPATRARVALPQPDGGTVILATFDEGFDGYVIERFAGDGHLDPIFGVDGSVMNLETGPHSGYLDGSGPDLAVDSAGRMYVATIMAPDTEDQMVVLRYTAAGVPDETWGPRGRRALTTSKGVNAGRCIRVRDDGTLIVGGRVRGPDGSSEVAVAKLIP